MELKKAIEMVSEACYHYDGELYENCNYSEAFDTVLKELDKKDKVIKQLEEDISNMYDEKVVRNILEDECGLSKFEIDEILN